MLKKVILLFGTLLSTSALAVMCPNNFNTVNVGDSVDSVLQQCGKPVTKNEYKIDVDVPQEWSYYVIVAPPNPATIQMTVVFVNKKVANITVNAMSLVSTNVCGGTPNMNGFGTINVGDDMDTVKAACGKPTFIKKGELPEGSGNKIDVTELIYTGQSPYMMYFENGKFQSRK